jgi:hypothetical protein
MSPSEPLLPDPKHVPEISARDSGPTSARVVSTRDRELIRRWAAARQAEPATGESTASGPATVNVNDGGAGIRFNFPGFSPFRPISWDEWFENFDQYGLTFVYDSQTSGGTPSNRYQIVRKDDWQGTIG